MKKKAKWITMTAVMIALLIVWQIVMGPLISINPAMIIVMGSGVNLLFIVAVMINGFSSGLIVSILAPLITGILGIGGIPLPLAPFIIAGNVALILVWFLMGRLKFGRKTVVYLIAAIVAAAVKFVVLYILVVKIAMPLLNLPPAISVAFSYPQFVTALIGGLLALLIVPVLQKVAKMD